MFCAKQSFFFPSKSLKYCQTFYLQNILIPIKFTQPKNSTDSKHLCPVGVVYIITSKIKDLQKNIHWTKKCVSFLSTLLLNILYCVKYDYIASKHCIFSQKHILECRQILCFCEIVNNIENVYKLTLKSLN